MAAPEVGSGGLSLDVKKSDMVIQLALSRDSRKELGPSLVHGFPLTKPQATLIGSVGDSGSHGAANTHRQLPAVERVIDSLLSDEAEFLSLLDSVNSRDLKDLQ
jgi:hypothetical protein